MSHTTSVNYLYKQIAIDLLNEGRTVTNDDVLRTFQVRYPEEWAGEITRMAHAGAKKAIKGVLRSLTINDDDAKGMQLQLPGVELPAALTIPVEGGYASKAAVHCTWEEYEQYLEVLNGNITAAVHERDVAVEAGERFRKLMEGNDLTFGEAFKQL